MLKADVTTSGPVFATGRTASGAALGVVVIGRNEGLRLVTCFEGIAGSESTTVYVDSGSTDTSVSEARSRGIDAIELDMTIPFTAARARNEGLQRLLTVAPDLKYVQFVDGDCELDPSWLPTAICFLEGHPDVAAVCGRLRERHPERSVYNLMADIEWDTPVGEARSCGGIVMMRVEAIVGVNGFRRDLIAGEEPELCVRLRAAGWKVWRLDAEMGAHDAAMLRFSQWWKRMVRGGFAFAQGSHLHGAPPEGHFRKETRSAIVWGFVIPLAILALTLAVDYRALWLFAIYPLQVARVALRGRRTPRENWIRSFFLMVGKFAEFAGIAKFQRARLRGETACLIEYK